MVRCTSIEARRWFLPSEGLPCDAMLAALRPKPLHQPVHLEVTPGCKSAGAEARPERAMVASPWRYVRERRNLSRVLNGSQAQQVVSWLGTGQNA